MTPEETLVALQWLAALDPRHGTAGDQTRLAAKAAAWWEQLPTALEPAEFKALAVQIMADPAATVTPVLIARRYAEARTPKHRQGIDHAPTPARPDPAPAVAAPPRRAITAPGAKLAGEELAALLDGLGVRRHTGDPAVQSPCPKCGARPWNPCLGKDGRSRPEPHAARMSPDRQERHA